MVSERSRSLPPDADDEASERMGGSSQEMARIVRSHYARLWRLVRRFGVPDGDVDDALQQVFLVAASKLPTVAPENERSYLSSVAVHVAANVRRKARRSLLVLDGDTALVRHSSAADGPDTILEQRQRRALLDEALLELDVDLRQVFVLCDLEEMPMREVAEVLDIAGGTVASRLRRAREEFSRIAQLLERRSGPRVAKEQP